MDISETDLSDLTEPVAFGVAIVDEPLDCLALNKKLLDSSFWYAFA